MKRILLVLTAVLCHGQASAASLAMQTGPLPSWETSASAPLRPLPAGYRLLEYVESTGAQWIDMGSDVPMSGSVSFDLSLTSVPSGAGIWGQQVTGTRILVYFRSMSVGFFEAGTAGTINFSTLPSVSVRDQQYGGSASAVVPRHLFTTTTGTGGARTTRVRAKLRSFSIKNENGILFRDYLPVKDANGVAGLWDRVSGQIFYSATATPLVAGPPVVDPEAAVPALLPHARNWYAPLLLATNPPPSSAPADAIAIDALVIPEGLYATRRSAGEIVVAEPHILDALVQRYRTGLAPTNIPVNVLHSPTNVVGRVTRLWRVPGSGLWARIEAPRSSFSGRLFPSAEVLVLRSTATDDWGSWAEFEIPWQVKGVSLVPEPALAVPSFVTNYPADPSSAYPDPRTVDGIRYRH